MRIEKISIMIALRIKKYGEKCKIQLNNGGVIATYAVARRLWDNNKTKFESESTPLGQVSFDYVRAVFPADCSIGECSRDDEVVISGVRYYFAKVDAEYVGGRLMYYNALLRMIKEEDEDVFK